MSRRPGGDNGARRHHAPLGHGSNVIAVLDRDALPFPNPRLTVLALISDSDNACNDGYLRRTIAAGDVAVQHRKILRARYEQHCDRFARSSNACSAADAPANVRMLRRNSEALRARAKIETTERAIAIAASARIRVIVSG